MLFTFCVSFANAQYTLIPDSVFEQKLINLSIDTGLVDGRVLTSRIDTVKRLDFRPPGFASNISNLTGIEDFNALESLFIEFANISDLNLSQNINLDSLQLVNIGPITKLDLSNNSALSFVSIANNFQLLCLNIKNGNNTSITSIQTAGPLTCVEVDNPAYSNNNWGGNIFYSTNCYNACITVGIEENQLDSPTISPNPTSGNVSVKLTDYYESIEVKLYNRNGQIVLNKNFNSTNILDLNLKIESGLYLLLITSNSEIIMSKKILKK